MRLLARKRYLYALYRYVMCEYLVHDQFEIVWTTHKDHIFNQICDDMEFVWP